MMGMIQHSIRSKEINLLKFKMWEVKELDSKKFNHYHNCSSMEKEKGPCTRRVSAVHDARAALGRIASRSKKLKKFFANY